jgi:hypothetical protein
MNATTSMTKLADASKRSVTESTASPAAAETAKRAIEPQNDTLAAYDWLLSSEFI